MRTMSMVAAAVGVVLSLALGPSEGVATADDSGALTKLVDDAAQRLQTADPVAASKYLTGGAVDDPAREQAVIESVTAEADAKNIDSNFVRDVFRNQIDATDSLEHSRFAQWKIKPEAAPKMAPDLSSSRDAINTLNDAMVQDIGAQWNALHGRSCPVELDKAKVAAVTRLHLDPLYQSALDYAVHGYCR